MKSDRKLHFKGSHREIGQQVGELYKSWGRTKAFVPPSADIYFSDQLVVYEKYFPAYLEYLEGVAIGLGVDIDLMIKSGLTAFLPIAYQSKEANKCSSFALVNAQGVFVGRNYDWREASELHSKLFTFEYTDTVASSFTGITDMATWEMGGKPDPSTFWIYTDDAWNTHGLFICLNGAPKEEHGIGLSSGHVVQLVVEQCKTTAEALALLEQLEIDSSKILTIADKSGDSAVVEKKLGHEIKVRRSKEMIFASNHFNHPDLILDNESIFDSVPFHSTFGRYHYLETKLGKYKDEMSLEKVQELMNKPPVLQNWRGKHEGDTVTVWILAMNLVSGEYEVRFGPLTDEVEIV